MIRLYLTLTILLLPAVCLAADSPSHGVTQSISSGVLTPDRPMEGRLAAGEKHLFTVHLNGGQTCRLTMAAGENVITTISSAEGSELGQSDSDQEAAGQSLLIVAAKSGEYHVQIKTDDQGKPGSYTISVDDPRAASERDRQVAEAQNTFLAAVRLSSEGNKASSEAAIKKYETAAGLWQAADDKRGQAQSLFRAGDVRFKMGNAREALQNLLAALPLAISAGRHRMERMLLDTIGNAYTRLSQYEKALDYLNQELIASRSTGDKGQEGQALNAIGLVYASQSQYQKALESYGQALPLLRAAGDRESEGAVLSNMGLAYNGQGQSEKALEYYNQALPISQAVGDRIQCARVINNIGLAYYRLSEYDKALEHFSLSLPIRRELGDRSGEAIVLSNIGLVYRATAQYDKAIEYYTQALPILHDIGNRAGEAVTLSNLGVAYSRLGQYDKALECFNKSLPVSHEVGNKTQEASTLNNLGLVYTELGQDEKALEYYNQSLPIQRGIGDRMQESGTLDNLGVIYRRLGQTEKALDYYNRSLGISRAMGNRADETLALTNLGLLYSGLRQYEKAQEFYAQALEIASKIRDRFAQMRTLEGMAEAYRSTGDLTRARSAIEQSIAINESVRSEVTGDQSRSTYFASSRERFDFYISLLMEMNAKHEDPAIASAALEASERSRARSLLDLMAVSRVDINEGVAPSLKAKEQAVYAKISQIQSELIRAHSRSGTDPSRISTLENQLEKADDDRQQLQVALRRSSPRYAELKYPAPLTADSIKKLIDPDTLLLEYSLGRDGSFLFAVTDKEVRISRLCPGDQIRGEVDRLRASITSPGRAGLANYLTSAAELYQELLAPASALLKGKKRLVIVPDGSLYYLPFEVLLQKGGPDVANAPLSDLPYLVRDFTISYAPSVSVLALLGHGSDADGSKAQAPQKDFIAFADPDYGDRGNGGLTPLNSVVRGTFGIGEVWKLDPLPGSRVEAETIASLFPGGQSSLFLGSEATEENVKAEGRLAQYRYIHFAVHGLVDESQPQFTSLILSLPANRPAGDKGVHEDGLLQEFEIFNLKLRADIVTLSACETGLGKQVNGEGLVGLSRAFFYAGAPSLLVSLWKVDDRSTADLMESFYRQLRQSGMSKSNALRQAKMQLIGSGRFAHPYYWAPFVLTGKAN